MSSHSLGGSLRALTLPSPTMPPFEGTTSYLIANQGVAAVVDPGFDEDVPIRVLEDALAQEGARFVKAILLTHTHPDHVTSLERVWRALGEPAVYVHPNELQRVPSGPSPLAMNDGRTLTVGDTLVTALHTPGHSPGHLCFHLPEEGTLLAGDLLSGAGSIWVGVPEGDSAHYLASLERAAALPGLRRLGPAHGPLDRDPYDRLAEVRAHRLEREQQVLSALDAPRNLSQLRELVYPDSVGDRMSQLTEASLLAHLRKLMAEMRVVHLGEDEAGPFVAS